MVSPCTTEHSSATRPAPDSVIDAVCADPDLLTLEFEAIMAANYPAPAAHPTRHPPRTPPASATRRTRPGRPNHPATRTPQRAAPVATPQRHQRARQRGPPTRAHRGLAFDPTTPRPERRLRIPTEPAGPVASRRQRPTAPGMRPSPTPTPEREQSPRPSAHRAPRR
jgi:hypothetical protein